MTVSSWGKFRLLLCNHTFPFQLSIPLFIFLPRPLFFFPLHIFPHFSCLYPTLAALQLLEHDSTELRLTTNPRISGGVCVCVLGVPSAAGCCSGSQGWTAQAVWRGHPGFWRKCSPCLWSWKPESVFLKKKKKANTFRNLINLDTSSQICDLTSSANY